MEALVAEREARGPFKSLDDFAERIDPRLLNRRQIESLAAAGAFDQPHARPRGRLRLGGDHPRPCGQRGGAARRAASTACSAVRRRPLRADPPRQGRAMVAGPAHGRRARLVRLLFLGAPGRCASASARGATRRRPSRSSPTCRCLPRARAGATMAGLVEEARWRTSAQGPPLPDGDAQRPLGPVPGEHLRRRGERRDRGGGAKRALAGLLTVELDKRAGDELPRVAIKRFQPLEALAKRTRLQMEVRVSSAALVPAVARELRARARRRRASSASSCRCRPAAKRSSSPAAISRSTPSSRPGSSGSPARAASTSPCRSRRSSPSSAEAHAIQKPSALTRPVTLRVLLVRHLLLEGAGRPLPPPCAHASRRARGTRGPFRASWARSGPCSSARR